MSIETINTSVLKNMFIAGAKYLESKKDYVDELNVFPVPDGDTGTNMSLTILAAAKEVEKADSADMAKIAKAISSGSLRGARGNSGVILSQLFRGFAKEIGKHDELDTVILATAVEKGVETAYKAVMKPKEGTILTVSRAVSEKATEIAFETNDIVEAMKETIEYAEEVLEQTPDMLPVLKEAGVVDAGGQGLIYVLKGALLALENGTDATLDFEETTETKKEVKVNAVHGEEDIKFGYCTEFIVDTKDTSNYEKNEREATALKGYLETIGDSIVAVADEDLIKIHVHTNNPGDALQRALEIGQLVNIKIENMREQHSNIVVSKKELEESEALAEKEKAEKPAEVKEESVEIKENALIAVSIGDGLSEVFKSLGVDYLVEGGQTMNPSTDDFVKAVDSLPAKRVFIFPNNKNIILAAKQVEHLIEDKEVYVIESTSVPQGITSLLSFDPTVDATTNFENMTDALEEVKTGQVTFAVRDTSIDSIQITEGDILGIAESKIVAVEKTVVDTTKALVDNLIDEDSEIVTLYHGEDVTKEQAQEIQDYIEDKYDDIEVEVYYGGQPLYYYLLSVE